MALPAGALQATITAGGSVGVAGTAGTVVSLTVRPESRLTWAATGEAIERWAEPAVITDGAGSLVVLADQDGVLTSGTVAGAPVMLAIRGWTLRAEWYTELAGHRERHVRRFPAPAAGATVDLDMLPEAGVPTPATITYAQTITVGAATAVQQVTLTAPLAYTLPVGVPADVVHRVVFTQDTPGGHPVTYGGQPVAVNTTAGATTLVEVWPNGEITYPGDSLEIVAVDTQTLAPGAAATVTTVMDGKTATLNFGIPAGSVLSPDPVNPELYDVDQYDAISPKWHVTPEQFGAIGDGITDDTAAIQAALDGAATLRAIVRFTADTYAVSAGARTYCLSVPSHSTLDLGQSWIQQLAHPILTDGIKVVTLDHVEDVRIFGGTIAGDRLTRGISGAQGDGSACLSIYRCRDVYVRGVTFRDSVGDGCITSDLARNPSNGSVALGGTVVTFGSTVRNNSLLPDMVNDPKLHVNGTAFPAGTYVTAVDPTARTVTLSNPATSAIVDSYVHFYRAESQNIRIEDCTGDNNRRNGITVAEGRGITIRNSRWINTNGTSPEAGIDVEPYYGVDLLHDVVIEGCTTSNNVGGGLFMQNMKGGRIRDCFLPEGLMIRATADCHVTNNRIGGLTLKSAGAVVSGNSFNGTVGIYNYASPSHGVPLDVTISGNDFSLLSDASLFTIFNPDNAPSVYRDLSFTGNTIRVTVQTTNKAMFQSAPFTVPVFESVTFSRNDVSVRCTGLMSSNITLMFHDFPRSNTGTIQGNRLHYSAGDAYTQTRFARLAGTSVLVADNEVEWSCPNLAGLLQFSGVGTNRVIRNTLKGSVPLAIERATADPVIHAVGNVSTGPAALAAVGVLTTDTYNTTL